LCGQTLRVVAISQDGKAGPVCTVELQKDIWRRIPVNVTNLGRHEPMSYPLPLNLPLVGQLLELYTRIEARTKERTSHDSQKEASPAATATAGADANGSASSVAAVVDDATAADSAAHCATLPNVGGADAADNGGAT
jgi:hypothetical protein